MKDPLDQRFNDAESGVEPAAFMRILVAVHDSDTREDSVLLKNLEEHRRAFPACGE